ncbi:MAG: SCP2 sterol-binding domain-containing protein [Polyangiaceae bacterium]
MRIHDGKLEIQTDHHGRADVTVTADGRAWIDLLAKNRSMLGAVLSGKLWVKGSLALMKQFSACLPS